MSHMGSITSHAWNGTVASQGTRPVARQPNSGTLSVGIDNAPDQFPHYVVVVEGGVTPHTDGGAGSFDPNDLLTDWGRYTLVSGGVAGGSDSFDFHGPIRRLEVGHPDAWVELDGQRVNPTEVVQPVDPVGEGRCGIDGDCPPDFACQDGLCVDTSGGGGCSADGDCPDGFVCQDGVCVESGGNGGGDGRQAALAGVAVGAVGSALAVEYLL